MQILLDDLRHAIRQLRKSPGFAITAILTLAVGIGATTAIFTLVYDVLLKPLPYTNAEQLVVMQEQVAELRDIYPLLPINANHFVFWQQHGHSFQSMAMMEQVSMPLGVGEHPLQIGVLQATPSIFSVLDSMPMLGRMFSSQEDQPGHEHVIVLMNSLWRDQFQSNPDILGKTVTLNGFPYTVVGVMPSSFHLPHLQTIAQDSNQLQPVEALLPMALTKDRLQEAMGDFNYFGLARLKPGISVAQANAEINAMQHTISAGLAADEKGTLSATLTPFQEQLVGSNQKPLLILLAAVAGLLVVGCVNITNLLLARAVGRRQSMAVAAALGASRAEMLRMALRETAVLAAVGSALGIFLAAMTMPVVQRYLPPALNFRGGLQLDWVGALCALTLAVVAAFVAGALPAWMSSHTAPHEVLHSDSRLASESRSSKRARRILVTVEVAVSVALVLMTGLLTTSLVRLLHVNRGFDAARIATAKIDLPTKSYPALATRAAFYKQVLDRISQLPGVEHAAVVSVLPLAGDEWIDMIRIPGDARAVMQVPTEHFRWVTPGYFETIQLPLVAGRFMTSSDEGKHVAVISERTARTLWAGKNPIGQTFSRAGLKEDPSTVIGVVGNARVVSLASPDPMMVYMPYWYRNDNTAGLLVRTHQDPETMADAIRKAIWSVDPEVPVPEIRLLGGIVADSVANRRFEMQVLLLFAVSALLLAGLGVYGVVTYSVVQREREIGLRLALGAQKQNIYGLVLHEGLVPVLAGALAGVAVAFASARIVNSLLFEVSPYNSAITAGAVGVLVMVGVAACLLPARRAAIVEPMQALRRE
ncbi:MAG TPA: ABC transporter permease [Acidobacteriaceae bacterium]|nr:ABC transporter permease [Acidobacteriaceae bacterium]